MPINIKRCQACGRHFNVKEACMCLTFGPYVRASVKRDLIERNRALRATADHIATGGHMPLSEVKALELSVALWRGVADRGGSKWSFYHRFQKRPVKAYGELGDEACWLCKYDLQMRASKKGSRSGKVYMGCSFCPYVTYIGPKCYAPGTVFTAWTRAIERARSKEAARKVLA